MRDLLIIGSGPAGYTAAVYAARAGLKPLVVTGERIGGWLTTTTEIENFPGFPEGIQGAELMERMKVQAERFGAEVLIDAVTGVDLSAQPFKVSIGSRIEEVKTIIVATGSSARRLNIESEERLWGKGVSVCATCDGFFFRDKEIAVVGGGDSAMEEATFLTRFASKVTVLVRGAELRASKPMQDRARSNPKIELMFNVGVIDILGEDRVTGLRIKNFETEEESELSVGGLFLAIGHIPNSQLFEGQLELLKGYIVRKPDSAATSVEGVFVCGDVADWRYRQAITAAGTGCMAALEAQRFLEK
ncbi:thioredoxin-disulfide reductase [Candidatus Uhrbacteria bacterium RIFOXYC2_FULL_47_19]|uniref:Thioredoxin reductase n=1 Tax=Candidatus Uhrbacteria bacterium RIFOXYC2_FULL_47_19 TaxID=1802424 RepID=A0A1F7WH82_9BACT|nr:MAG: thioredoxin-disulfide reductase [Candidatus Uhrbacteria bacterium RIFOXYC2_FULL_47_19]HCC22008.1 thioredoxin-disulfide reductase [Candidatus Uhrbacteria bacterium]